MAWMTVEAAVVIISGINAASIALVGFGVDTVIEFFCRGRGQLAATRRRRGTRDPRVHLIGIQFFVLSAYLAAESIETSSVTPGPNTRYPGSP